MAVDPATVRTRIKTLLDTLDGVGQVYKYAPRSLVEGDCPQFVILRGRIVDMRASFADGGQRVGRIWRLLLFLGQAAAGTYGDLEKAADPWDEKIENLFAANHKLNDLDPELVQAMLTAEDGEAVGEPGIVEFPPGSNQFWVGVAWELRVLTKRALTLGT